MLCKMYTRVHFTDVSSVYFSLLRVAVGTRVKYVYLRLTLVKHSVQQPCRRTAIECYVILLLTPCIRSRVNRFWVANPSRG